MMVPMADFMNHLPVDTTFDVYSKVHLGKPRKTKEFGEGVLEQEPEEVRGRKKKSKMHIDYSMLFSKEFLEDIDPEKEIYVKGVPDTQKPTRSL